MILCCWGCEQTFFQPTAQDRGQQSYEAFHTEPVLHPFNGKRSSSLTHSTTEFILRSISELILNHWKPWPPSSLPALLSTSRQIRWCLSSYKGHKANKNFVSCIPAASAEMQPCLDPVQAARAPSTTQTRYAPWGSCNSLWTATPDPSVTAPAAKSTDPTALPAVGAIS